MATVETLGTDEQRLAELGYKQELRRGWSKFSNFAISFSIISVLSGCFTTYGQGFLAGGPVAISIGWPVISLLILTVAFSMSELASAMPTAGGIYYWASKLGGPAWGWFTGWFNLIGLVAVVASVGYGAAAFLTALLGMYNVHFVFNFASTAPHYHAHVVFTMFVLVLVFVGLVNVFSSHLVSLFNGVSVWWHVAGVAAIVGIMIAVPAHHASFSYVFTTKQNATGFSSGSVNSPMYWFFVLPIGFLLTMYTITGYDASAHLSEETHGAADSAPKGVWRSVAYSAVIGWILLLALTFAVQQKAIPAIEAAGYPAIAVVTSALSSAGAKAVILISVVGQLFCVTACATSASRMTFAFSRDGAVPGHTLWRRLGPNRTPTWAVFFVVVFALIITIPAYFPNSLGTPVAFLAVTSVSTVGLYIAYVIPVFLRWRAGSSFVPGPWTLGNKYKWMNLIAIVWVAICVVAFSLPTTAAGMFFRKGFSWNSVNYAPFIVLFVIGSVTIWYYGWARKTFTGPVRTIDLPGDGGAPAPPAAAVA